MIRVGRALRGPFEAFRSPAAIPTLLVADRAGKIVRTGRLHSDRE